MRPRSRTLLLAALVAAALLAGCVDSGDVHRGGHGHPGDGDHHGGGTADGTANLALDGTEAHTVDINAGQPSEFRFTPDRLEMQPGERVGVRFTNAGDYEHEFSIPDVGFHLHLEPGETASAAFIAPAAGEYVFGCYLPGHFESGMKGTLVVSAP